MIKPGDMCTVTAIVLWQKPRESAEEIIACVDSPKPRELVLVLAQVNIQSYGYQKCLDWCMIVTQNSRIAWLPKQFLNKQ